MPEYWERLGDEYRVEFEADPLRDEAEERILMQFRDKPAFVGFVRALLQPGETLAGELAAWARGRSVYYAVGEQLDALGRIVGWRRGDPIWPNFTLWFAPDYDDTSPDKDEVPLWVRGAVAGPNYSVADDEYRYYIVAKAIRNSSQYSSVPEVVAFIKRITGVDVRIDKVAPDTVDITPLTSGVWPFWKLRYLITVGVDDDTCDKRYVFNYPAGCYINDLPEIH